MEWLFERMIETAAWVAFILGIVFLGGAVWNFVMWAAGLFSGEGNTIAIRLALQQDLLVTAGQAAIGFIFAGLALGGLACIDRYVFDIDD